MSWDERYSTAEYVYGTEPNGFLVEHAGLLRGPVLSLAEGEGRNGVFLAGQGLTVHGVDSSAVGLAKAQALAAARGVSLHVEQADLAEFCPPARRMAPWCQFLPTCLAQCVRGYTRCWWIVCSQVGCCCWRRIRWRSCHAQPAGQKTRIY